MSTGDGLGAAAEGLPAATAPYGSWPSAIDASLAAGAAIGLTEPWVDGEDAYWIEARPAEGGRRTLLCRGPGGAPRELTPAPFNVRDRVHEYGGGSYTARVDVVVASSFADGRLFRLDREGFAEPVPLTPEGSWRYADLRVDPLRPRLYAVREDHDGDGDREPANVIVAVPLDGGGSPGDVLVVGPDFVASPRPSPDGRQLAWLEWDHPSMPWDETRLRVAQVRPDGTLGPPRTVAGGPGESVVQPDWSPAGVLHLVSDRSGWWNLYSVDADGELRTLAPMAAEFGDAAWVFDRSFYGFASGGGLLAVARRDGADRLYRVRAGADPVEVALPFTELEGVRVSRDLAVVVAAGPRDPTVVARLDPGTGDLAGILARSLDAAPDPGLLPDAEALEFPVGGGATARALYYRPANAAFRGPDDERPPLIVLAHGGPTSNASTALSLERAFFTSRGIAIVDVDYRGSTGYGRAYRDALRGQWGIADVEDCVAAAEFLAARGDVDPARLVIRGGSSGGYTVLAALVARPEVFAAGISHFGIADLELLMADGHKFESRYSDSMIAPWPDGREMYRERSPIHRLDRLRCPMLLFQGLDDRVVPPSQAEAIVAALAERNVPHAARFFPGEGHGFRRAETRREVLETELAFLGRVLGFTPADALAPLDLGGDIAPLA